MATYHIIAWRGVPASLEVHDAAESLTVALSDKFQQLIDSAAMQLGLHDAEAYIEQWSRGEPHERAGSAREVADAVTAELEARFPEFIGQVFRRA
jgi:hypothetical protein